MHAVGVARTEYLPSVIRSMQLIAAINPSLSNDGIRTNTDAGRDYMHTRHVAQSGVNDTENTANDWNADFIETHAPALIFNQGLAHLFIHHARILNNQIDVPAIFTRMY